MRNRRRVVTIAGAALVGAAAGLVAPLSAHAAASPTTKAVDRVNRLGLRLSTPDEWEYACGGGALTLFRWGDDTPSSGYPYDHRTGPHRERNLWGLAIGQDHYKHEWTTAADYRLRR
jgi:formylglycine-generating enzyme required for sulfatase activity